MPTISASYRAIETSDCCFDQEAGEGSLQIGHNGSTKQLDLLAERRHHSGYLLVPRHAAIENGAH